MNPIPKVRRDEIAKGMMPTADTAPVEWVIRDGLLDYDQAVEEMETLAGDIRAGKAAEAVWLVEHPALYTAGTSAKTADLLTPNALPVYQSGRGGEYTYHGPGQRVAYVMLDLTRRKQDVRAFVTALEDWVIATLDDFNVKGERRENRVGVWVSRPEKKPLAGGIMREDKIAAIGIRLRKWVSFHGVSINLEPDLDHYSGIVSCGIEGHGVTSLVDLGLPVSMAELDISLKRNFEQIFGPVAQS